MTNGDKNEGNIVRVEQLHDKYPTHLQPASFWEELGRTIATFGFLENCLTKAIFAYGMIKEFDDDDELEEAYMAFIREMEKTLSDALGALIEKFRRSVEAHREPPFDGFDKLITKLQNAKEYRNVISHGFWQHPDGESRSLPFFVNRKGEIYDQPMDTNFLASIRHHVVELSCEVINTVTARGWQFPSSGGPGKPVHP